MPYPLHFLQGLTIGILRPYQPVFYTIFDRYFTPGEGTAGRDHRTRAFAQRHTRTQRAEAALKQLKKMDRFDASLIVSWIGRNLEGCEDPRAHGKGLTADRSGEWRYRVGDYRILCLIQDDVLVIEVFAIGHRRDVYK